MVVVNGGRIREVVLVAGSRGFVTKNPPMNQSFRSQFQNHTGAKTVLCCRSLSNVPSICYAITITVSSKLSSLFIESSLSLV